MGDFGELGLETPRDRKATFDPKIVAKGQTRWTGFDDKIISMYARGMTTREIQGHLEEIYAFSRRTAIACGAPVPTTPTASTGPSIPIA